MQMVTLKNFKSYKNQMVTNISPRINLIIGKNGQGKSNFFKGTLPAIQPSSSHLQIKYISTGTSTTLTSMYTLPHSAGYGQRAGADHSRAVYS